MTFTEKEQSLVKAVFGEVLRQPDISNRLGSITVQEMQSLYQKLKYEWYEAKYGVPYEQMDDFDFERAYREEWES